MHIHEAEEKLLASTSESTIKDFFQLLKPRVMSLVIFSGFIGLQLAPGDLHPFLAFVSILCISLGSGAAGAINMWYDRDIDAIMQRTKERPIPKGKIEATDALNFGILIAIFSVTLMAVAINILSAILLASAILFYVFIYTIWLKRSTPQNIVIGGVAGSLPPMIGWSSVTNQISLESVILFLIIFTWTVPHFWALSLYKKDDYEKVGIPMMPNVAGESETRKLILIYSILMVITVAIPALTQMCGLLYAVTSTILSAYFLFIATKLFRSGNNAQAPALFGYSIIYLFLIFGLMLLDHHNKIIL